MQVVQSYLTTWKCCSDLWVWWFPIIDWLQKSCSSQKDSRTLNHSPRKWFNCTNYLLNSYHSKIITISVWEQSRVYWLWQAHLRDHSRIWRKTSFSFEQCEILMFQSSSKMIYLFSLPSFKISSPTKPFLILNTENSRDKLTPPSRDSTSRRSRASEKKSFNSSKPLMSVLELCSLEPLPQVNSSFWRSYK